VTDDELRAIGQKFIDSRRELLKANPFGLDPASVELGNRRWDYIDPLRMGVYVLASSRAVRGSEPQGENPGGCWVVDFDHIQHLCTNPSAFAVKREHSARIGDLKTAEPPAHDPFLSGKDLIELAEKGEPILLDGKLIEKPDFSMFDGIDPAKIARMAGPDGGQAKAVDGVLRSNVERVAVIADDNAHDLVDF